MSMTASTALHVIVGAGPVGTALARRLATDGLTVKLVSRSGSAVSAPGVVSVAADASDADALTAAADGADALYNCANPGPYTAWERRWPPLATAILTAAMRTGAVLVTASNLYGYGPVHEPMTRSTPLRPSDHKGELRASMWQQALTAHEAGLVRAVEARASDYLGAELPISSGLLARYADSTLAGRTALVFADPEQPHTWTAIEDVAATLAALGRSEAAWGSAWLVPSPPALSVRQVLERLHARCSLPPPRLRRVPRGVLRAGGLVVPLLREVTGILYQFDAPFVADGAETTELLGIEPTPWERIVETTAPAWYARATARRPRARGTAGDRSAQGE